MRYTTNDMAQYSSTSDNLLYVPKPNIKQFRNSFSLILGGRFGIPFQKILNRVNHCHFFKRKYLAWSSTKVNKSKFISHITDSVYDVVYFVCMIVYIFC